MTELRIIILCGRSPRHLYVANRLCCAGRPIAIVQETGSEKVWEKFIKLALHPRSLKRKCWRFLRDRRRYAGGKEARFFFGTDQPFLERKELLFEVPHINHQSLLDLVQRTQPDLIAVFGTSLIKNDLLEMGKKGIVNLHGGPSPHYRGADCTFWALFNGEPEHVGCTIHFIDKGIDTGRLIAHVFPEVKEGDDELTLFWRAVKRSSDVYSEFINRLGNGEFFGLQQKEKGSLYQVKDRTWKKERELKKKMGNGLLSGVHLPLRVKWYGSSQKGLE